MTPPSPEQTSAATPSRRRADHAAPLPPPAAPYHPPPLTRYLGYLRAIARREMGRGLHATGDSADIVQETFLDAHRDLSAFHGSSEAEFLGWLRSILRNNARSFRRSIRESGRRVAAREVSLDDLGVDADSIVGFDTRDMVDGAYHDIIRDEAVGRLRDGLATLPDRQRAVVLSKIWLDRSFRQIGDDLGCSAPNAFKIWKGAIESLRSMLREDRPIA